MHLQFRDADEIGIRYMELGEPMGAARAIDLVVMEGESCAACGGGPSTERSRPNVETPRPGHANDWHRVCFSCDRVWEPSARKAVLRSEVEIPTRRDGVEAQIVRTVDEWGVIRPIVETRPHALQLERRTLTLRQEAWDFAVIAWLLYLRTDVGSVRRVVEIGSALRPQFELWWRDGKVRREIITAQEVVEARAHRARVLTTRRAHERMRG